MSDNKTPDTPTTGQEVVISDTPSLGERVDSWIQSHPRTVATAKGVGRFALYVGGTVGVLALIGALGADPDEETDAYEDEDEEE
jgi:hypothetical protein